MCLTRRITALRLAASLALSGCAGPAALSAALPERRIVAASKTAFEVAREIARDPLMFGPYRLDISGADPLVVRGWVASEEDAVRVESLARRVPGVRRVEPDLAVLRFHAAR
jgi:hypothetical protein